MDDKLLSVAMSATQNDNSNQISSYAPVKKTRAEARRNRQASA